MTVRRWRAFAVLGVSYFMTIVDLTIVNVALPTIGSKLHFSETNLQWVVTAYGLTFGGFLLLGGRAADLLGRRRLFTLGLVTFVAASLACGLATTDTFLIAMRGIQGLGAAIVLPAALSIVMNMFEQGAERNKALGAWGGIAAAGGTFGLIAGGLLTRYVGWQFIFFLNVPIGAAALLLTPRLVPESRLAMARRLYDPLGAVTVTVGLLLLVYALSQAPQHGWGTARTLTLVAGAAALMLVFVAIEARGEAPLLPLRLFRRRMIAGANLVGLLLGGSFFGAIFVGTLYMQQVLGYSPIRTGVAWLATSLTSVALAGLAQALVTRVSARLVLAVGMGLVGGGVVWAAAVPVHGSFFSSAQARRSPLSPSRSRGLPGSPSRSPVSPPDCSTPRSSSAARSASRSPRPSPPAISTPSPAAAKARRQRSPAASNGRSGSAARSASPQSHLACFSSAPPKAERPHQLRMSRSAQLIDDHVCRPWSGHREVNASASAAESRTPTSSGSSKRSAASCRRYLSGRHASWHGLGVCSTWRVEKPYLLAAAAARSAANGPCSDRSG
jgi:EmrB/QacA subfamily drug resistance transporter